MENLTDHSYSERDACGVGYVAQIDGTPSHEIVSMALEALANHSHRGAVAADGAARGRDIGGG